VIIETIEKLRAELAKADAGSLAPAGADELEKAKTFGFPRVLLDFYRESAPNTARGFVELGQRIWSVQNAIAENRDYVPGTYLFPLGYVVFGSTKFGDAYCIDTVHTDAGEYPVALFPHDVIAESSSLEEVETYRLTVANNLEDFLQRFTQRTLVQKAKYG
jgi:hypothetical protein